MSVTRNKQKPKGTYQPQFLEDVQFAHRASSVFNEPWVNARFMEFMAVERTKAC